MVPKNRIGVCVWVYVRALDLMRPKAMLARDSMLLIKMKMNVFRADLLT